MENPQTEISSAAATQSAITNSSEDEPVEEQLYCDAKRQVSSGAAAQSAILGVHPPETARDHALGSVALVVVPPEPKAAAKKRGRPPKEPPTEPIAKKPVSRPKTLPQPSAPMPPPPPQTPMQIMAEAIQHRQKLEREHTIARYASFMPPAYTSRRIL